jgi:8-oxo-dGTP pyrophosphatase MutT (NUDIX family)
MGAIIPFRRMQMFLSHSTRKSLRERLRRLVGGSPARVQAAALPWRESEHGVEVMLITSRGTGRWVLPKGWPEGEEDLAETALREAAEEAGLDGSISRDEAGRYFYGKALPSGMVRRCEVHVYPLKVESVAKKWPEKGKRKRMWVAPRAAAALVEEADLRELLSSFCGNSRRIAG